MAVADWQPGLPDVADHVRRHTVDANGNELGTFTAETRPTADEVGRAIGSIIPDVVARGDIPVALYDQARGVAALGAAAEVIIDRDPALSAALWERYGERLVRLHTAVDDLADGVVDSGHGMPASGRFPAPFRVSRAQF